MNVVTTRLTGGLTPAAEEINREHALASKHAETAVVHAIRCGTLLIAMKLEVGHGNFGAWCAENLPGITHDARSKYMAAAREAAKGNVVTSLRSLFLPSKLAGNCKPAPTKVQISAAPEIWTDEPAAASTIPEAAQLPAKVEPEAELPPEAHDLWEPDADEEALIEREQKEFRESIGNVMGANGEPVNAVDEIKRLTKWIADLTRSRDWYMQEKSNITAGLKEQICKVRSLGRKLDKEKAERKHYENLSNELQRQVADRDAAIHKLQDENEALRERVAIMAESSGGDE